MRRGFEFGGEGRRLGRRSIVPLRLSDRHRLLVGVSERGGTSDWGRWYLLRFRACSLELSGLAWGVAVLILEGARKMEGVAEA